MTSLNQGLERLERLGADNIADSEFVRGCAAIDLVAASHLSLSPAERAEARELARWLIDRAKDAAAHRAWFSIERVATEAQRNEYVRASRAVTYAAAELVQRAGQGRWSVRVNQTLSFSVVVITWGACTLPESR